MCLVKSLLCVFDLLYHFYELAFGAATKIPPFIVLSLKSISFRLLPHKEPLFRSLFPQIYFMIANFPVWVIFFPPLSGSRYSTT
jgi:hypothetical protein